MRRLDRSWAAPGLVTACSSVEPVDPPQMGANEMQQRPGLFSGPDGDFVLVGPPGGRRARKWRRKSARGCDAAVGGASAETIDRVPMRATRRPQGRGSMGKSRATSGRPGRRHVAGGLGGRTAGAGADYRALGGRRSRHSQADRTRSRTSASAEPTISPTPAAWDNGGAGRGHAREPRCRAAEDGLYRGRHAADRRGRQDQQRHRHLELLLGRRDQHVFQLVRGPGRQRVLGRSADRAGPDVRHRPLLCRDDRRARALGCLEALGRARAAVPELQLLRHGAGQLPAARSTISTSATSCSPPASRWARPSPTCGG